MFGQPRPAFGGTSTGFGASFSTPSTGSTGFGSSFGKPAFGNPTTSFGAPAAPFGATTSSGPSLFGTTTQPQTGSLFGQQQTSSGFGSSGGGLFSQSQPSTGTGLFGSNPSTGFGAQQTTQSRPFGFGTTSSTSSTGTTGLFGSTQSSTSGGLFNTTGMPTTGFGTTNTLTGTTIKYDPTTGTDTMTRNGVSTNIRTRIEVITTMKEYENKSLEELRVEDYLANRKGPGQGSTMSGFPQTTQTNQGAGLFGAAPAPSMFATNKQGTENKSLFGTGTTPGFGTSTAGSLFGTSTSTFGQAATSTPGFSFGQSTQAQKPTGFSFGSTPTTSTPLFGATTSQPSTFGGLSSGFTFGQTNQQSGTGLFGNQNKGFLSNQPATGGLFGNKTAGTTQPLGGTGFGTTPSAFGTTPTTSTGGSLFGQTNQNKPGLFSGFGNSGFGTSTLFGAQNQQKPGLSFGTPGFGTTSTMGQGLGTSTGVGLFNQGTSNAGGMTMGCLGTSTGFGFPQQNTMGGGMSGGVFPDLGKLVKAMTEKPLFDIAVSNKSASSSGQGSTSPPADQNSPKLSSGTFRPVYVLSPSLFANNKPRPKPINKSNNQGNNRHWLFKGLDDPNEEATEDFLKPKKYPSVRKLNLRVFRAANSESSSSNESRNTAAAPAPSPLTTPISPLGHATPHRSSQPPSPESTPTPDIIKGRDKVKRRSLTEKQPLNDTLVDLNVHQIVREEEEDAQGDAMNEEERDEADIEDSENKENNNMSEQGVNELTALTKTSDQPHPAGIKLTLSEYYTLPSLEDLKDMIDSQGRCVVENLTVGRYGYGNVCFLGVTDVTGLDFDSLISIYRKQVEVYPEGTQKPPQGQELNKPAIITLDCVWPVDKTTRQLIKSPERLQTMGWSHYLERQCVKMDTNFIEYRPVTGSWVFKVKHFSKYGLQEENEEEMDTLPAGGAPPTQTVSKSFVTVPVPLPPISTRAAGPPVTATSLTSPPQFLSHIGASAFTCKSVQPRYLDSPSLQDSQVLDEDFIEPDVAQEPEESAALSVLSPSDERLTVASKVPPRAVQLAKLQLFIDDDEDGQNIVRETTPTPQLIKASAKKLILGQDVSHTRSSSPVDSAGMKVKFTPHSQGGIAGETPKISISAEPSLHSYLRDSRTEYQLLPSGKDFGQEAGHVPPQHQTASVPLASSLMSGKDQFLSDMGAFMGRSFRVGWGPGWTLVHAGKELASLKVPEETETEMTDDEPPCHPSPLSFFFFGAAITQSRTTKTADSTSYKLVIEQLHAVQTDLHTFDHLTEACLNDVWKYSVLTNEEKVESDSPSCPHYRPVKDRELLHQLALTASSAGIEHEGVSNVFNLCVGLWGRLNFYSPESDGANEYSQSQARMEAVSQWLENVNSSIVQEEVLYAMSQDGEEAYLAAIFSHLTARQISEACMLALSKGDHHLALLLAQSCTGEESPRQILAQQLRNWAEGGTDAMMSTERLILYSILAGAPTHQASHIAINTCQGLDWKRAFALHLWYMCPATSTIAEVLQEYDQAAGLQGDVPYCEAPLPSYLACLGRNGDTVKYDICYHLLKLFTDPMHRLETLLNPATVTADPIDVTVSWLLWRVLESLGYHHLSEHLSAGLHLSMAALMEATGNWHWAAFVLLNIVDEERRTKEIQALLQRHIVVGKDSESDLKYNMKENFIIEELHIPQKWIYEAKSIKARVLNMVDEEAWYLLKAGDYNRAHMLIIETIAPNSIVNEDHDYLQGYLCQFCDDVQNSVVDWAVGGGVYTDYLDVCSVVDDMKKSGDPTPAQLEQLRPRLLALCSRLNNLKCSTATHRLCVSEMSRVVVGVLRAVVGDGADATQVLSQQLSGLPLTHDYALAELNLVTEHYLAHLSTDE
ncbi:nuclear pore complex protein Nup98-Nup96-like isoform X2 [Palaemon carinicauda]|uniref:nuclear pore complex protein Nup98-Nup96-like isoform X2 n=1 Tax=Palaemon carinicauda TaxID=392227 RepID=UPI0035B57826